MKIYGLRPVDPCPFCQSLDRPWTNRSRRRPPRLLRQTRRLLPTSSGYASFSITPTVWINHLTLRSPPEVLRGPCVCLVLQPIAPCIKRVVHNQAALQHLLVIGNRRRQTK